MLLFETFFTDATLRVHFLEYDFFQRSSGKLPSAQPPRLSAKKAKRAAGKKSVNAGDGIIYIYPYDGSISCVGNFSGLSDRRVHTRIQGSKGWCGGGVVAPFLFAGMLLGSSAPAQESEDSFFFLLREPLYVTG